MAAENMTRAQLIEELGARERLLRAMSFSLQHSFQPLPGVGGNQQARLAAVELLLEDLRRDCARQLAALEMGAGCEIWNF